MLTLTALEWRTDWVLKHTKLRKGAGQQVGTCIRPNWGEILMYYYYFNVY